MGDICGGSRSIEICSRCNVNQAFLWKEVLKGGGWVEFMYCQSCYYEYQRERPGNRRREAVMATRKGRINALREGKSIPENRFKFLVGELCEDGDCYRGGPHYPGEYGCLWNDIYIHGIGVAKGTG